MGQKRKRSASPVDVALQQLGCGLVVIDAAAPPHPQFVDVARALNGGPDRRRRRAALADWLAFRGRKSRDPVCAVLYGGCQTRWFKAMGQFLSAGPHEPGAREERAAAMRAVRAVAIRLFEEHRRPIDAARWEQLRRHVRESRSYLMNGLRCSNLPWNFDRWLSGDLYGFVALSRRKLAVVERHLGIAEGTFLSHPARAAMPLSVDLGGKGKACLYRFRFEHDLPSRVLESAEDYFRFKTDPLPLLRRGLPWTPDFRGRYPSRRAFEATLRAYWNFAVRPKAPLAHPRAGLGLDPERLEFIDLFRKELIVAYLRWHFHRTGKVTVGVMTTYYGPLASILDERTGWIAQQPERFAAELRRSPLRRRGDPDIDGNDWAEQYREWVGEQLAAVRRFRDGLGLNTAAAKQARVRDSFDRIDGILRLPQPLTAVFELIDAHIARQRELVFSDERQRIDYETRTFLLVFLAAVPLRCLTLTALRLGRNVFRRDGRWAVRIERELFKNRRYLAKRFYEVTLSAWATPHFDRYVEAVRPNTLGARAGSPFLFPVNGGHRPDCIAPISTHTLQRHVRMATRAHWNAEISPHAWRHICATAILKDDPEKVVLAATVLNDAPKTVMKAYAHILPEDAFRAFAAMGDRVRGASSRPSAA